MTITSWFYGKDLVIDAISILVLLLIIYFSIGYYRINRSQKKYLYLLTSFILLSISYLFRISAHYLAYSGSNRSIEVITHLMHELSSADTVVFWSLLIHRILSLFAFYILCLVYSDRQSKLTVMLIAYLLLVIGYISHHQYIIYHLTMILLISLIVFSLFRKYREQKAPVTLLIAYSFAYVMLSQILFILIVLGEEIFIIAEVMQLLGYLLLMYAFLRGILNAKKKRET